MARWVRGFTMLQLVFLLLHLHGATGLDNGLGLRPVMGYNTWYDHGCSLDQPELELTVKAMQTTGLVALGYTYFDLDDCWASLSQIASSLPPSPFFKLACKQHPDSRCVTGSQHLTVIVLPLPGTGGPNQNTPPIQYTSRL